MKAMRSNDKEYKNLRQLVATLERERALVNGTENDELIEHQVEDLQAKREVARKVLKHLESVAEIQIIQELSGEQPWTASSWQKRSWRGDSFRVDVASD